MDADWGGARAWRLSCQSHWGAPSRLDLWAFAKNHEILRGAFSLSLMDRALEGFAVQPRVLTIDELREDDRGVLWFELQGKSKVGQRERVLLRLQAKVVTTCQRCMEEMDVLVSEQIEFDVVTQARFDEAEREDVDPDEPEMLVGSRQFDVMELLEDQLILAIPYVPKHATCSENIKVSEEPDEVEDVRENPFEVLANLKTKRD
ncbi:YceD family protein [Orrella sp. 11846]|uniref:YceD family protein n=1 Tax=Orrella sp. 11846 TaxID=3409913 RepID=UPI003B5C0F1A